MAGSGVVALGDVFTMAFSGLPGAVAGLGLATKFAGAGALSLGGAFAAGAVSR
jgi:hypothetical protein